MEDIFRTDFTKKKKRIPEEFEFTKSTTTELDLADETDFTKPGTRNETKLPEINIEDKIFGSATSTNNSAQHSPISTTHGHTSPAIFHLQPTPTYRILVLTVSAESRYTSKDLLERARYDRSDIYFTKTIQRVYAERLEISHAEQDILIAAQTADEDQFTEITNIPYNTNGIVLLCDLSNPNTLFELQEMIYSLKNDLQDNLCPILIVGNENPKINNIISDESLINLSNKNNCVKYIKTCIQDGTNCKQAFEILGGFVHDEKKREEKNSSMTPKNDRKCLIM